jgi:hypothetical protein
MGARLGSTTLPTMAMIISVTRAQIVFGFDGKIGVVEGEAYLRGHGTPDFIVYANTLQKWNPPHEAELLDDDMRRRTLDALVAAMSSERKMTVEVE